MKNFRTYLAVTFLFAWSYSVSAQAFTIDSLQTLLSSTNSSSDSIVLMNQLVESYTNTDLERAILYAESALELAIKENDKKNVAYAQNKMGLLLDETNDRLSAKNYFEKSERLASELGDKKLQVYNLMSIAKYYRYVEYDSTNTVNYFKRSVEICKAENFDYELGRSYAKLASYYTRHNEILLSESYLEKSAKYYLKTPDGNRTIAHYYNEVGNKIWDINPKKSMDLFLKGKEYAVTPQLRASLAKAYAFTGDYDLSLELIKEAIHYFKIKEKSKRMWGVAMAQLAEVYIATDKFDLANDVCDEAIATLVGLGRGDKKGLPAFYRIKGLIEDNNKNDAASIDYFQKSIDESTKIGSDIDRIKSRLALGFFYISKSDIKAGKNSCETALQEAKEKLYSNLEVDACECLYQICKKEERYADALEYHEQKLMLNDSLSTLKVKHALDINKELAIKDKEQEIREQQLNSQKVLNRILFIAAFLGLVLIAFLSKSVLRISRQNKEIKTKTDDLMEANLKLADSNIELERFAHIASHDLKSPLVNILSYTALIRRHMRDDEKPLVKNSFEFIDQSGKRMKQLIADILEYSKLSSENESDLDIIDLNDLVSEVGSLTQNKFEENRVNIEVSDLPIIKWGYSKIFLLFKNIIENGLKYNESKSPTIKIHRTFTENGFMIHIEDNGIGIKKEYFDSIFTMFNRLHNQNEYDGTGLGLATCKKIVAELNGTIKLESEVGVGTKFMIEFPKQLIYNGVKRK